MRQQSVEERAEVCGWSNASFSSAGRRCLLGRWTDLSGFGYCRPSTGPDSWASLRLVEATEVCRLAASGLTEPEYLAFLRPLLEFLDQNSLMHKPINSTIQFIYDNFTVRTYESFFQSCQSTAVVKVLRQGFSSTDTITCTALSSTRSEVSSFPCHRQPHVSSAHSTRSNHTLRQLVHLHLFFLQMG